MSNLEMKVDALMRLVTAEDSDTYDEAKAALKDMADSRNNGEPAGSGKLIEVVEDVLTKLGMPNHILGFDYVAEAICLAVEDKGILKDITKRLYPTVAKMHQTTASRAERAIRHGIELCWSRCDYDVMDGYFGCSINPDKGKPTNSEFIARVASMIRRRVNGAA